MTFAPELLENGTCPYPEVATLDVRAIPHPRRPPLLFAAFGRLESGQAFRLVNDHDPVPIRVRLDTAFPGQLAWEYLEEGPTTWQVRIGKQAPADSEGRRG